jgi:hypothetical protein
MSRILQGQPLTVFGAGEQTRAFSSIDAVAPVIARSVLNLEAIARNLRTHYPNLKIAFFSSRTRSYTYWRGLSPEPLAFETGFAVIMVNRKADQWRT